MAETGDSPASDEMTEELQETDEQFIPEQTDMMVTILYRPPRSEKIVVSGLVTIITHTTARDIRMAI